MRAKKRKRKMRTRKKTKATTSKLTTPTYLGKRLKTRMPIKKSGSTRLAVNLMLRINTNLT